MHVGTRPGSVVRTFFTLLALPLLVLPLLAVLSAGWQHAVGHGAEWIGAASLVFIATGVWRLVFDGESERRRRDVHR